MRLSIPALTLAVLAGQSGLALADDTNSDRPIESHKQMMKDCMQQERQANPTAQKEDMKRTCREKIKSYNDHPSETAPPPQNPTTQP
jgi:hypothetical protein